MLPDHIISRILVYTLAICQTGLAPVAFLYFIYYIFVTQITTNTIMTTTNAALESSSSYYLIINDYYILPSTIHYWLITELMFYMFFHITRNRMEKINPQVPLTSKQRRSLLSNCIYTVDHIDEWLPGWFIKKQTSSPPLLNELYKDNIMEWLSWAFFNSPLEDILQDEGHLKDMEWMMKQIQQKLNYTFQEGYNDHIQSRRKNLDPLTAYHRPLVFYIGIQLATIFYGMILQFFYKMKKYGPEAVQSELLWNFVECRTPSFLQEEDEEEGRISYWYRDGNRKKKPIIFIHGIGAGLMCYTTFLHHLLALDNPIFLIELPFVAMRCVEDVPTMHEISHDIQQMLARHEFQNATFVAHSLGSAVTSWCLQHIPKSVASVILLDPICFMLHYPDVCTNFVYRNPKTAGESIVKYFASSELYISYYISRHFHWFQLALYVTPKLRHNHHYFSSSPKHLLTTSMPSKTKVYLSEHDNIVNSSRVHDYLINNHIDNEMMKGLDHASFLFYPSWQRKVIANINDFTQ